MKRSLLFSLALISTACLASPLEITTKTQPDSPNGNIKITVTGGELPYTVDVKGQVSQIGEGPNFIFDDLAAGMYEVEVTDSSNESQTISTVISESFE